MVNSQHIFRNGSWVVEVCLTSGVWSCAWVGENYHTLEFCIEWIQTMGKSFILNMNIRVRNALTGETIPGDILCG